MKREIGKGFLHIPTCRDDVIWGTYFLNWVPQPTNGEPCSWWGFSRFLSWITWRAFVLFYIGHLKLICCVWIVQLRFGITFLEPIQVWRVICVKKINSQDVTWKSFTFQNELRFRSPRLFLKSSQQINLRILCQNTWPYTAFKTNRTRTQTWLTLLEKSFCFTKKTK